MNEPPVCALCEEEYWLEDGMDPSKYCHPCAQTRVSELEPMLKKLRDFIEFGPYYGEDATNIVIEADKVIRWTAPCSNSPTTGS
jgi:hypothetical protein